MPEACGDLFAAGGTGDRRASATSRRSDDPSLAGQGGRLLFRKHRAATHIGSAMLWEQFSPLQMSRQDWQPVLPTSLLRPVVPQEQSTSIVASAEDKATLESLFPKTWGQKYVSLVPDASTTTFAEHGPIRVGVVLSGGQAPGGHNVISGIYDFAKRCNFNSQVIGFLGGPHGIFTHQFVEVTDELMEKFRNQGGFDMICSGRHKIETEEQKQASAQICTKLDLHGLIVIGGDDSNTNAAILAEYFQQNNCSTVVVGVPKTIDGDLRNEVVEASFGYDTAVKTYSEFIGNLGVDVLTSKQHYHFVRLMGRSATHIALECALQTRANLLFVGEEVERNNTSLSQIVDEVVDMVIKRQDLNKNYGLVLLPEGLIEFIPEIGTLIGEINSILAKEEFSAEKLTSSSREIFNTLPSAITEQLLLERDPHGNVQVAKIATEWLLILMVKKRLNDQGRAQNFHPLAHYFGYEGRCALPSNFDANYCYALGHCAGALIDAKRTGYIAVIRHLERNCSEWEPAGCPLTTMMNIEMRHGKPKPVIKKYLVDLKASPFLEFAQVREEWKTRDCYRNPGPIQYSGPLADAVNYSIIKPTIKELLPSLPSNFADLQKRHFSVKSVEYMSPLQKDRLDASVNIPLILRDSTAVLVNTGRLPEQDQVDHKFVARQYSRLIATGRQQTQKIITASSLAAGAPGTPTNRRFPSSGQVLSLPEVQTGLRVGVALCDRQAPGVMSVVTGLFEKLSSLGSTLIGFHGSEGLLKRKFIEIKQDDINMFRNQGGLELLGRTESSEGALRTTEGLEAVESTCKELQLDGLVIMGGTYAMTDVAVLSERFLEHNVSTKVIGVPCSQGNNVKHPMLEACIGFDSASKAYASLIGNLLTDAASATKYWYFVRLMGRDPSHIVLESALQTHPNFTVISEDYATKDSTLEDVARDIADVVQERAEKGKNFGTVLVPEGLIQHLPGTRQLLAELNSLTRGLANPKEQAQLYAELVELQPQTDRYSSQLTPWSLALLKTLPEFFRRQLVQPTENGRTQLSAIATEELLSHLVKDELTKRKKAGTYKAAFNPLNHFFGYQGRSALPSNFDTHLGTAHGYVAAIAVASGVTGAITTLRGLCAEPLTWRPATLPITVLLRVVPERETTGYGRHVPMVCSGEVDLRGRSFRALKSASEQWVNEDRFCNPGPVQFFGCGSEHYTRCLFEEQHAYLEMLEQVESLTTYVQNVCSFGVDELTLRTAALTLSNLKDIIQVHKTNSVEQISEKRKNNPLAA